MGSTQKVFRQHVGFPHFIIGRNHKRETLGDEESKKILKKDTAVKPSEGQESGPWTGSTRVKMGIRL